MFLSKFMNVAEKRGQGATLASCGCIINNLCILKFRAEGKHRVANCLLLGKKSGVLAFCWTLFKQGRPDRGEGVCKSNDQV